MVRARVVGVMGGKAVTPEVEALAETLGQNIAKAGWTLLNGGRDKGVMAASARGARAAGGFVVGIHPGTRDDPDVADADLMLFSGMGSGRNIINVLSSDAVVALPGGGGTRSEVALAVAHGRPVATLGWRSDPDVPAFDTVEDGVGWLRDALSTSTEP